MFEIKDYLKIPKLLAIASVCGILTLPAHISCASRNNMPSHIQERFNKMDTNSDGKVVLEEFRTSFPNMNEQAFVVIDKNGDNGIDQAEWFDFMESHAKDMPQMRQRGAPMNNIPGDPLIPPMDSDDLPLVRPPGN